MQSIARHEERIRNMSAIAQKVYNAVPASEPWSMTRIHAEMQRLGGSSRDSRIVQGCLNSLKDAGLVEEPARLVFIRSAVRPDKPLQETAKPTTEKVEKTMSLSPAKQPRTPMAILTDLAARCKALADDIETAALEIDEHVTAKGADADKLKQLQALLKGLS